MSFHRALDRVCVGIEDGHADDEITRFAMGTLGWGPGVALYFVFGLLAAL